MAFAITTALEVLQRQLGKHPERVFTYRGRPIAWTNTRAWRKALKRAGIEDFAGTTFATRGPLSIGKRGTPTHELQRLGGWRSPVMVERYAHLAPDHLAQAARRLDPLLGYDLATLGKKEGSAKAANPL